MIEKSFSYTLTDQKTIERVVADQHVNINHIVLAHQEALPIHRANVNVYMIVVRGQVTLILDETTSTSWPAGSILAIPEQTQMNVSNQDESVLEFFIVKAPAPQG